METDELVIKLSAVMWILFEFSEVLDDRYADGKDLFLDAITHLGETVTLLVVDEMKQNNTLIPRPKFTSDVSFSEDLLYSDLARLEAVLKDLGLDVPLEHQYHIRRAEEAFSSAVRSFLLADRRTLAPETEAINPWSVLNADS